MPVPVFTVGEVLTAANMNKVGLWLVKTQTVGTAEPSKQVTGAFSADFDNYLVTYTGGTMSAATALTLKLGTTASGYYGLYNYANYATLAWASAADNNSGAFTYFGGGDSNSCAGRMTLLGPNIAKPTRVESGPIHYGNNFGTYTGIEASSTQQTAFTIAPFTGTMTGGTIRVYGYRN